jgi:enterochelin esterase-like enzyme
MVNLFLFSLIGLMPNSFAKDPVVRTVIAKVPYQTYPSDVVYLSGDSDALCNWKPNCLAMTSVGYGVYQANVSIPAGKAELQFQVSRGGSESLATNQLGEPFGNTTIQSTDPTTDQNMPVVLQILGWKDRAPTDASPLLQIIPNFVSPELNNSRTLRVLLPKSYAANPTRYYPVIYMHDGQNLFDSATANYKVEWNVDETYTSLISQNKIDEAIVVGIDANADRLNEYDYTIKGKLYAQFLIEEVMPYINQHYRTLTDRDHTFLSGSSMGAHISLALLWLHPDLFSKAAGLSFPAEIHNNSIYQFITASTKPSLPIQIYLDHGDYNNDAGYPKPADAFIEYLETTLQFPAAAVVYKNFPYADHFEADWGRRFAVPLQFLLTAP